MKIGIGIISRDRNELVSQCVENILINSHVDKIVLVDDASKIPINNDKIKIIRNNTPQGIAKSKNKCISYLDECDHIFLFDDDCWPIKKGWEKLYINTSINSGCNHFCFTWTKSEGKDNPYFNIINRFKKQKILLSIKGLDDEILDDYMHDTHVRIKKVRAGLPAETLYTQKEQILYDIKEHEHACGVMLYVSKKCIDTIGGFNYNYNMYGCEHTGFSNRIFNTGLNPLGLYIDVNGSEEYFYARDQFFDNRNISVLSYEEKIDFIKQNEIEHESEIKSNTYIPYK